MHLNAKKLSLTGLLMAFTVLLVILSSIFETNTFFLLALASFCNGIILTEMGIGAGAAFMIGSAVLSFFVAPNKFYVATFAGFCIYLVVTEFVWQNCLKRKYSKTNTIIMSILKLVLFNLMYIPMILWFPKLLVSIRISPVVQVGLILGGQLILVVYDIAYRYFINRCWIKIKLTYKL